MKRSQRKWELEHECDIGNAHPSRVLHSWSPWMVRKLCSFNSERSNITLMFTDPVKL